MSFRSSSLDRQLHDSRRLSSGTLTPPSDHSLVDELPPDDLPLPPAPETATGPSSPCLVSAEDLARVELFYASRDSRVCVCRCHAHLSTTSLTGESARWRTQHRGVPVWLLTDGSHRRRRQLRLVLVEPNTAFPLWMQTMDDPTAYAPYAPNTHDVLSRTDGQTYRLTYRDDRAAGRFLAYFRKLTSCREDAIWTPDDGKPQKLPAKSKSLEKSRQKSLKSATVGEPCAFNHVTRVRDIRNSSLLESLSDMIAKTTRVGSSLVARSASSVGRRPTSVARRRYSNASTADSSAAASFLRPPSGAFSGASSRASSRPSSRTSSRPMSIALSTTMSSETTSSSSSMARSIRTTSMASVRR